MSKRGCLLLVSLLLLAAFPSWAEDKLKIGFISTLSNPALTAGPDLRDGFMLGIADSGGRLGGRDVDLVIGDDQGKPDVGVELARQMLDQDKVQLITGIVPSNIMLAVAHTVLPRRVFVLSVQAGPSQLAGAECSPYFFAASDETDTSSDALGAYLQQQGVKSVYLIAANYAAGRDLLTGFKRSFKGEIKGETYTPLNQFDFAAELAEIRQAEPDAVFYFYTAGAPSIDFVKQYAEAGLKGKIPLYSVATVLDEQTLPGMGDAAIGVQSAAFWVDSLDNEANRLFVAHYQAAYHRRPSVFAAFAYDGARLLDAALKKVDGHIERQEAFRQALESAQFASVRGNFRFNANHFPIQSVYLLEVTRDKNGAPVNTYRDLIAKDEADAYAGACKMP